MKPMIFVFPSHNGKPIAVNIDSIKNFEPHETDGKPARTCVNFGSDARPVILSISFDEVIATLRGAGLAY